MRSPISLQGGVTTRRADLAVAPQPDERTMMADADTVAAW
jgi:hypothetical protein